MLLVELRWSDAYEYDTISQHLDFVLENFIIRREALNILGYISNMLSTLLAWLTTCGARCQETRNCADTVFGRRERAAH